MTPIKDSLMLGIWDGVCGLVYYFLFPFFDLLNPMVWDRNPCVCVSSRLHGVMGAVLRPTISDSLSSLQAILQP